VQELALVLAHGNQGRHEPMRTSRVLKLCFFIVFEAILLIGIGLGSYGTGGPAWAYSLGVMVLSALMVLIGLSVFVAITIRPRFVVELRSRKFWRGEVKPWELSIWYLVALGMIVAGTVFFFAYLNELLAHDLANRF
jgi:hypothetical protein